ncbi:beta-ketoacyl-[acyl-carrier-protein] synthase family protein [Desulfopila inferna]|uniref:beta-ketoacyl-[acyl-carrier-protein] synthase family protein n=1 Tax=Desulfopila inferna TaxID=468528 RepID=UPI00196270C9|nr:beta-ketoacyl-[acyl-carrier-protein] synthase family protein [Desulfopila inferna]MBM9604298.1 beta-ketoacyl-[acyl-carrier-protein] synthase family protein [Desulfopila inferna]
MGKKDAVIVGYDAISPLGCDLQGQWQNAVKGLSGIGPLTRFPLPENFPVRIAGQVPDIVDKDYPFLTARHQAAWTSPVFKYSLLSVARALERSNIELSPEIALRTAVTYSSAIGGLDAVLNADRRLQANNKLPPPYTNPNACVNMVGGKIAIETGAQGPITSTISACATGLTSIIIGAMFLAQNRADIAICGAVDFALVEPIVAGFYTMNGAYAPAEGRENEAPEQASRPFSANRRGFVIAEGAGAIILATREFAETHGLRYSSELAGWGMTSDAHHFVAPNSVTIRQCMQNALTDAGLLPQDIAAINAHAASTKLGDKIEYSAMKEIFGNNLPPVCANKSLIGHAMGASSAIETIFALQGMQESILPPTINYQADPEIEIDCVAEGKRSLQQEFILKNSFGFGGCNSSVIFKKSY